MFLVLFVLPQILVLGDRIVERTSFHVKLPAAPVAPQRVSGAMRVNGRVRGRISGFVDAEIHGVVRGDISAIMTLGSLDPLDGDGLPPDGTPTPTAPTAPPPAPPETAAAADAPPAPPETAAASDAPPPAASAAGPEGKEGER